MSEELVKNDKNHAAVYIECAIDICDTWTDALWLWAK